jgi:prepilin-type N-terminal cleavage/methylation domain-containing protein
MATVRSDGFTLVETVVVMAIIGLLFVIVFTGQAVSKIVETIGEVKNEAASGVNTTGDGTGDVHTSGCPNGDYQFAGTAWSADSSASTNAVLTVDYYKAKIDKTVDPLGTYTGTGCKYATRSISTPSDVRVNVDVTPILAANLRGGRVLFVRTLNGAVTVCRSTNMTDAVVSSFANGMCIAPNDVVPSGWKLTFSDGDGHTADVGIDTSGLAKRLN